ncbi:hypothetical protein K474DRAFT_1028173 [Panus rudis PR-1116 ss-1]|nr:hypothetical protein K474DRAFT_1028173 [Panus rudis PR-1116 ss-1]
MAYLHRIRLRFDERNRKGSERSHAERSQAVGYFLIAGLLPAMRQMNQNRRGVRLVRVFSFLFIASSRVRTRSALDRTPLRPFSRILTLQSASDRPPRWAQGGSNIMCVAAVCPLPHVASAR